VQKTINKIIISFMVLVVFDATSFNIEKTRFGILGSVVNTVNIIKSTVKAFR